MTIELIQEHLKSDSEKYQTPCYVYSANQVRDNYKQLKQALGTQLMMSIKANHCLDLVYLAGHDIDGIEVASEFELNGLALLKNENCYINNPSMTEKLVRKAVAAKVHITLDHPGQIQYIVPLKTRLKPVFLRLSAALLEAPGSTSPKRLDHFGMDHDALEVALQSLQQEEIKIGGIHLFRGSNTFNKVGSDTLLKLPALIKEIESKLGYPLESINLGGGFESNWQNNDFNFEEYRKALKELAPYKLMHESGRAIFASAGQFLTTIVAVKKINDQVIVICDGGMAQNFLLAQTETPLKKVIHPLLCQLNDTPRIVLETPAKIVGSSCNRDDVIGQLPAGSAMPEVGDVLIFENCGAYNRTYSPTKFLGLTEAREYILDQ